MNEKIPHKRMVKTDVLRRVYQNIIPPKLRKSLGEFYTPTWAAELLLNEVGYEGNGRILDPTCGSGTSLVAAIQRVLLKNEGSPQSQLSLVSRAVVGYDLNPIAVATARLNYVLALVDTLIAGRLSEPIAIPVFLADSLLLPEAESRGLSPHFKIPTRVGVFQVPILQASKSEQEIVEDTRHLLRLLREKSARPLTDFLSAVREAFGPEAEEPNRHLLAQLHKMVHSFQIEKHDGIWASIAENFFAPTLEGRFEYVVGNPHWAIPRRTPQSYTKGVREVVAKTELDKSVLEQAKKDFLLLQTRSVAAERQYFAFTPFVWRALRSYTAPNGKLAFLLTSSMFTAMGAGGWRKWISQFPFLKIIDMTLITDIHEGALCWSYIPIIENGQPTHAPIQYSFCVPIEKREHEGWDLGPRKVEWHKWLAKLEDLPISPSRIAHGRGSRQPSDAPWLVAPPEIITIIRKMQMRAKEARSDANRLGDTYEMHMGFKADWWKYFAFQGPPSIEGGVARGKNKAGEAMVVEAELIFATAVGSSLRPWVCTPDLAFLPLDPKGNLLTESALKEHDLAWEYVFNHKRDLVSRAVVKKKYVNEWFGVLVPKAAKGTSKVAYRLIATQLEAVVLPPSIQFVDRRILLLPDQHVRFIEMKRQREAAYLAGLLNSSLMRCIAYMGATPKGGVPWREFKAWNVGFLPIIRFSEERQECAAISDLASKFAENPEKSSEKQDQLDGLVAQLYGVSKSDAIRLRDHLAMMKGIPAS